MGYSEEAVQVTFKGAELTAEILMKIINFLSSKNYQYSQKNNTAHPVFKPIGEQDLNSLSKQNRNLDKVDVHNKDFVNIRNQLKVYNVDFAVIQNQANQCEIFFKASDRTVLEQAFKNVISNEKKILQGNNPSKKNITAKIEKAKVKANTLNQANRAVKTQKPKISR